jgi:hypothetical protein
VDRQHEAGCHQGIDGLHGGDYPNKKPRRSGGFCVAVSVTGARP